MIGECYEIVGNKRSGYVRLWAGSARKGTTQAVSAHRVAWMAVNGPIPEGAHVLHHCDNRACIRASHLYLGDNAQNVRDKVSRARQWRKLDDEELFEIEMAKGRYADIAARFSVSKSTVCRIKQGSQRVAVGSSS